MIIPTSLPEQRVRFGDPGLPDTYWSLVTIQGDGCWRWNGSALPSGHGWLTYANQRVYAYRLTYQTFVAPIPPGFHVDHLCRFPRCVNPEHLEAVTARLNIQRARFCQPRPQRRPPLSPECGRGHVLPPNRYCLACRRIRRVASGATVRSRDVDAQLAGVELAQQLAGVA